VNNRRRPGWDGTAGRGLAVIGETARVSLATAVLRRAMRLPAPRTSRVTVDRDVAVPMTDGAVLRHDHHRPAGISRGPVVLVRSPYGRAGWIGVVFGRLVAERGLQVVVQSVRGTADSDGVLSPFYTPYNSPEPQGWKPYRDKIEAEIAQAAA